LLQGDSKEGSLFEHLEELRAVILRMLLSVALAFPVLFYFSDSMLGMMIKHLCPPGMTLKFFSPIEPFVVQLKIAFYGSVFVMAPYLLGNIWGFVAPALYDKERSIAGWLTFFCWLLFLAGSIFSVLIILPLIMKFSFTFESMYLQAAIGIGQFVGLVFMLIIGFGLMFQFPAGVFILVLSGLVDICRLKALRPYIFLGIFIVSALLTPPDVFSQVMMGIPTYLLFEIGLLAASLLSHKRSKNQVVAKISGVAQNEVYEDNYKSEKEHSEENTKPEEVE
jgi:sec-independent protein translocase protein TatC